jgi:hypothetical protein
MKNLLLIQYSFIFTIICCLHNEVLPTSTGLDNELSEETIQYLREAISGGLRYLC